MERLYPLIVKSVPVMFLIEAIACVCYDHPLWIIYVPATIISTICIYNLKIRKIWKR